jgi:hypothetical protein
LKSQHLSDPELFDAVLAAKKTAVDACMTMATKERYTVRCEKAVNAAAEVDFKAEDEAKAKAAAIN